MDDLVAPKIIAIVPARSGSKRIPLKNIKSFHGKPMLAWTIEAALASNMFADVFVSTDSEEIANIAKSCGASVPFLRNQYADDHSTVSEVTIHALQQLQIKLKTNYDIVVQLMPNCPLRTAETIKNSIENFIQQNHFSQISCFKFGWNNPWWAFTLDEQYQANPLFPENLKQRSQDLPELYCPTGAIWMAKVSHLLESKTFYDNHKFHAIPWREAIDIDTLEDWEVAERLVAR